DVCRVRLSIVCCLSFFGGYRVSRPLHSFPTRRSSDLVDRSLFPRAEGPCEQSPRLTADPGVQVLGRPRTVQALDRLIRLADAFRSEEHTSELQSRENLVCRLLLEKKKRHDKPYNTGLH